ncbi:MAG: hypothetical protein ACLQUY_04485 [Ktedonobacterales bacterium]
METWLPYRWLLIGARPAPPSTWMLDYLQPPAKHLPDVPLQRSQVGAIRPDQFEPRQAVLEGTQRRLSRQGRIKPFNILLSHPSGPVQTFRSIGSEAARDQHGGDSVYKRFATKTPGPSGVYAARHLRATSLDVDCPN